MRARDYGEVFTPDWMVNLMVASVEAPTTAIHARTLDLCAGTGAFYLKVLHNRLSNLPEEPDLATCVHTVGNVYAVELLTDNIHQCYQAALKLLDVHHLKRQIKDVLAKILQANIIQADVLKNPPTHFPSWHVTPDGTVEASLEPAAGFFRTIISNPPYQKNISGSTEQNRLRNHSKATPIYHLFYDYALSLNPDLMVFIIPAKWYTGGWGLDAWRVKTLEDPALREIHDYRDSNHVFPGVEVNGGICWMVRDVNHTGNIIVERHNRTGQLLSSTNRPALEPGANFFIRDENAVSILNKTRSLQLPDQDKFSTLILSTTPFGIPSNFKEYSLTQTPETPHKLLYIKNKEYWVADEHVTRNKNQVDKWKVFVSLSFNQHSPQVVNTPHVYGPGSVCTHSYLCVAGFRNETEARNAAVYMQTRFFRYLAGLLKISPIATRNVYRLIPVQDWSAPVTDEQLYRKYQLTDVEIQHVRNTVSL